MHTKGAKIFPDDVRTIVFSTGRIRTAIVARIFFRNTATMAAVPEWVREKAISPEGIQIKKNLFVDSHLVYNKKRKECLRILDWFPGVVDGGHVPVREVLIPWDDVKKFKAQTETQSEDDEPRR